MRKIYTVVFALMVLLSVTMSATALDSKTISRQNGVTAIAYLSDEATDSIGFISVTEKDIGTYINVYLLTPTSMKYGAISTQENVFDIDDKLMTATLSPVTIELYDENTMTLESFTIQAQWTGAGSLTRGSDKTMVKYGNFMAKLSTNSVERQATATGSIGDINFGTSSNAALIKSKTVSITMEK
jgi:hypothetical protein